MTATQIALVQDTFEMVCPNLALVALLFYKRLFELDPSLRSLVRGSREAQAQGLGPGFTPDIRGMA